jgi:EH_Signature domain
VDLELTLNSVRRLSPLVLPELTRLVAAKKRVLDRWPDIVPDPPERDHEAIILQMLALLDGNRWEDVKMSFVLRALKVAFGKNFRGRADVAPIIAFGLLELEATTQTTFLNAMVAIYLSSYEPRAQHSIDIGTRITAKRDLMNGKWRAIEDTYPSLLDANRAHDDIAASMVEMDEPWQGLKAKGFPNPHATGLMDYVHAAYVDRIRPNLNTEGWLDVLFKWLNPEPGKRKISGSIEVIEAVLGHWVRKTASDQTRQAVTEHLINQYSDPRTNRSLWVGVSEDYMNVIFSWLTREDLRFFTSVVDATQKDPQWQPRKKFWLKLYDEGLIEQAWVAFCPSAERYARTHLIRSGFADNVRRFAKQSKGGTRSDTSILIMKIGSKIVVDGCHNYRTHIFNIDDPVAPKLFRREYDCDADVMELAPWSKAHNSIPAWSQWVKESIQSKTPMSTKKPWRRSPARDDDLDRQTPPTPQRATGYTPATPIRTTYTPPPQQPVHSPPAQPVRPAVAMTPAATPVQVRPMAPTATPPRQAESSLQTPYSVTPNPNAASKLNTEIEMRDGVSLPTSPNTPAFSAQTTPQPAKEGPKPTSVPNSASGLAPFSAAAVNAEVNELRTRMIRSGDNLAEVSEALKKVRERQELDLEEEIRIANAIRRNRANDEEFVSLKAFVEPIFNRKLSPHEIMLWAAKANEIERIARTRGLISPNVSSALKALVKGHTLGASEKKAMEYMAQRLRRQGVELLEIIRRE